MNGTRRLIGSFNHGAMANALPQGIGAQASQPGRQVIALSGDGGLAMLLGELLTLRQQQLPVKIVVFNNGALSFVELEMKAAGIVNYGTDLVDPDFTGIARAAGLFGARVEKASELEDALRRRSPTTAPPWSTSAPPGRNSSLPPKITYGQTKGFSLYAPGPSCPAKDRDHRAGQDEPAGTGGRLTTPRPEGGGFRPSRAGVPVSPPTAPGRTRNVLRQPRRHRPGSPGLRKTCRKDVLGGVDVPVVPGAADGHLQRLADRLRSASRCPHAEQVLDEGYQRLITTRLRPYCWHGTRAGGELAQPQSAMARARCRLRTMP